MKSMLAASCPACAFHATRHSRRRVAQCSARRFRATNEESAGLGRIAGGPPPMRQIRSPSLPAAFSGPPLPSRGQRRGCARFESLGAPRRSQLIFPCSARFRGGCPVRWPDMLLRATPRSPRNTGWRPEPLIRLRPHGGSSVTAVFHATPGVLLLVQLSSERRTRRGGGGFCLRHEGPAAPAPFEAAPVAVGGIGMMDAPGDEASVRHGPVVELRKEAYTTALCVHPHWNRRGRRVADNRSRSSTSG